MWSTWTRDKKRGLSCIPLVIKVTIVAEPEGLTVIIFRKKEGLMVIGAWRQDLQKKKGAPPLVYYLMLLRLAGTTSLQEDNK